MSSESLVEQRLWEIKQLRNKANMLASIHSLLSDRYSSQHSTLVSVTLAISTLLIALTFSDTFITSSTGIHPDTYTWIKGITSIANFTAILLLHRWSLQEKAAEHREATRFYFAILNKIRQWVDSQVEITPEILEEIRTEYGKTDSLPKIRNKEFLKLKQWHLQNVAISRELEKAPFELIGSIQSRLSNNSKIEQVSSNSE